MLALDLHGRETITRACKVLLAGCYRRHKYPSWRLPKSNFNYNWQTYDLQRASSQRGDKFKGKEATLNFHAMDKWTLFAPQLWLTLYILYNGRPLSGMGITRERWCYILGVG